jgi:dTDP-L-rhamnose 4-epimerase
VSRQVLITGGAGFIGSHLARRFFESGYKVTVLDLLIPQVHGDNPDEESPLLRSLAGVAEVMKGDVTSKDDLRRALNGAEIVVHLAAETGTGQSMYEIDRYVETNVGGMSKLLDLLANEAHSVSRVVIGSSRAVYGEGAYRTGDGRLVFPPSRSREAMVQSDFDVHMPGEGPITSVPTGESAMVHPSSVYGITKQMQEVLLMTIGPSIGIETVALRYQNVYGPRQSLKNPYTGILSIFATLIRQGNELNIFEDGEMSRDFVYIDDVVEATFLAATSPTVVGAILNVGTGVATTVNEVVAVLRQTLGIDARVRVSGDFRLGDIRHCVADITRLREVLGYVPKVSFPDGVAHFVDWVIREPIESVAYQESLDEMRSRRLLH